MDIARGRLADWPRSKSQRAEAITRAVASAHELSDDRGIGAAINEREVPEAILAPIERALEVPPEAVAAIAEAVARRSEHFVYHFAVLPGPRTVKRD